MCVCEGSIVCENKFFWGKMVMRLSALRKELTAVSGGVVFWRPDETPVLQWSVLEAGFSTSSLGSAGEKYWEKVDGDGEFSIKLQKIWRLPKNVINVNVAVGLNWWNQRSFHQATIKPNGS